MRNYYLQLPASKKLTDFEALLATLRVNFNRTTGILLLLFFIFKIMKKKALKPTQDFVNMPLALNICFLLKIAPKLNYI